MEELIVKKSGIKYHYIHIYQILQNGDLNRRYHKKYMSTQLHPKKRKTISKKVAQILVDKHIQQLQDEEKEEEFTIVSLDESFFFYESLRRVWIEDEKRSIVRVTVFHNIHVCLKQSA